MADVDILISKDTADKQMAVAVGGVFLATHEGDAAHRRLIYQSLDAFKKEGRLRQS